MPEALSAGEVGREIAEHREHAEHSAQHTAAPGGGESSLSLAHASSLHSQANVAEIEAIQIRTLDPISFNTAETAYASGNQRLFALSLRRLPGLQGGR